MANGLARGERGMDLKLDDSLKSLIDLGKRSGYLTWDQVNAQIPPETVEPERLDQILELLDSNGISIIEEDQAEDRAARSSAETADNAQHDPDSPFANEGDGKHT